MAIVWPSSFNQFLVISLILSSKTCLIDPGAYRKVDEDVRAVTKGKGTIEVQSLAVADGDSSEN